jgi:hypothetical protein
MMKKIFITMLALQAIGHEEEKGLQYIRRGHIGTYALDIIKFEDGPNTCYVAGKATWDSGVGISCVKR